MASEISYVDATGQTLYAHLQALSGANVGKLANGTALEAVQSGHWANYSLPLTEATGTGYYFADMPALVAGQYAVHIYAQAGGIPAASDGPPVADGVIEWDGTAVRALVSFALDSYGRAQVDTSALAAAANAVSVDSDPSTFYAKQGDSGIVVPGTCRDAYGVAVSLAAATSCIFQAKPRFGGGIATIDAPATPDPDQSANTGKWSYTLTQSDLNVADIYDVTLEVTYADGHIETFPTYGYNTLIVEAELA